MHLDWKCTRLQKNIGAVVQQVRLPSPSHPFSITGLIGCRSIFLKIVVLFQSCIDTNIDTHALTLRQYRVCNFPNVRVLGSRGGWRETPRGHRQKMQTPHRQHPGSRTEPTTFLLWELWDANHCTTTQWHSVSVLSTNQTVSDQSAPLQNLWRSTVPMCLLIVRSSSSVKTGRAGWCTSIRLPRVRPLSSSSTMSSSTCELLLHFTGCL